jgi:hypothetical protein
MHGLLAAVGLPVPDAPVAPAESPATASQSATRRGSWSTTPTPGSSTTATASAVLVPLCQTYVSAKKPSKAMAAADLDQLAQAAGTADNIDAFCTELLILPSTTNSPRTSSSTATDGRQQCHGNGQKACPTPSG